MVTLLSFESDTKVSSKVKGCQTILSRIVQFLSLLNKSRVLSGVWLFVATWYLTSQNISFANISLFIKFIAFKSLVCGE